MKRFTFLLLSLMTLGMYAQTPISISTDFTVDYGDRRKGETVIWASDHVTRNSASSFWGDGNTHEVVENPEKGGINPRTNCLKVTCNNDDGSIGINLDNLFGDYGINLNGRRRISMLFKAGTNTSTGAAMGNSYYTQMQLETNYGSDGRQIYKLGAYYDATEDKSTDARHDGWKRLYFDFTPYNTLDDSWNNGYHTKVIGDYPDKLMFKPKICIVTTNPNDRFQITSFTTHTCAVNDVYYIDDIRVEDEPYAEGYWIDDNENLPTGTMTDGKWNTGGCQLPKGGTNGVLHLSGTWLKGENIVNPELGWWSGATTNCAWIYEFNEYRDLSWHVKHDEVKLMVFKDDAILRWPDRGGLLGTNGDRPDLPYRFINNLNVLIFAEKSCILPDEVDNLGAHWHDTNAVIHYKDEEIRYNGATGDIWEAWELELTDNYPFLNPQQFTVQNTIKLHRTMKPGFNTITYPFYVTAAELQSARVGSIYFGINDENLLFVTASQTEPNKPYITDKFTPLFDADRGINVTANYQEIHLSEEREVLTVDENYTGYSSDATSGTLYGTYKRISGEDKWAIVTDGSWQGFMQGGADSTIKPFRGYLTVLPNAASAGARSLSILDDDATGIGMVNGIETVETIHDLQGRAIKAGSLSSLPKGIYIINGKKTMIK